LNEHVGEKTTSQEFTHIRNSNVRKFDCGYLVIWPIFGAQAQFGARKAKRQRSEAENENKSSLGENPKRC
jgi:hypothetical protein